MYYSIYWMYLIVKFILKVIIFVDMVNYGFYNEKNNYKDCIGILLIIM